MVLAPFIYLLGHKYAYSQFSLGRCYFLTSIFIRRMLFFPPELFRAFFIELWASAYIWYLRLYQDAWDKINKANKSPSLRSWKWFAFYLLAAHFQVPEDSSDGLLDNSIQTKQWGSFSEEEKITRSILCILYFHFEAKSVLIKNLM